MIGETVELEIQSPVCGGVNIKVLIDREGIGGQTVVAAADGDLSNGRVGLSAVLFAQCGGQETLSAVLFQRDQLSRFVQIGFIREVIVACPAGFMRLSVRVRRVGLIVVEHIAQHATTSISLSCALSYFAVSCAVL